MLASAAVTPFEKAFAAGAGGGYIRAIPVASQIAITPGAASLTDGFPPVNFVDPLAGGIPPFGQDMNGILYEITLAQQWAQAGGLPKYNATFSTAIGGYPNGAVLQKASNLGFWQSTVDNNVTNPDAAGAGWTDIQYGATAAPFDNSTKLSTTSFVQQAIGQLSFRNVFINGAYQIAQVNADAAAVITAGAAINYAIDRWYTQSTGQNITAQRVVGASPFKYAYKLLAGATGPTTTLHGTRLEGRDCVKLVNQTVAVQVGLLCDVARTVTWTAYSANAEDVFATKTQIATGTISATTGQANYTFTFNAGANAGNGLCIEYTTGALTNSTGFIQYQGHQLEQVAVGATSGTTFEHIQYSEQLLRCQRYLPCWNSTSTSSMICSGYNYATSLFGAVPIFPVRTRVPVTGVVVSNIAHLASLYGSIVASGTIALAEPSDTACRLAMTTTGAVAGTASALYFNNAAGQLYLTGAEL